MSVIINANSKLVKSSLIDPLYQKICREKQGNVGMNKVEVVKFYYDKDSLLKGIVKRNRHKDSTAEEMWKNNKPKTEPAFA